MANLSLYGAYLQERTNDCIVETEKGFATYRFLENPKAVYIIDIYVSPKHRKEGIASTLADKVGDIAKEWGYTEMLGSVVPSAKGSTDSLRVLLAYGMTLKSADKDFVVFTKEIK